MTTLDDLLDTYPELIGRLRREIDGVLAGFGEPERLELELARKLVHVPQPAPGGEVEVRILFSDDDGNDLLGIALLGERVGLHVVGGEVVVTTPVE